MLSITVLVENKTSSETLICEHGLSFLLTCDDKTLLFDTGASNALLRNAAVMGVALDAVSAIVLSHGHHDHTGGLGHALHYFAQSTCRGEERLPIPEVIAHPDILLPRRRRATEKEPGKYLGVPEPALALLQSWPLQLIKKPLQLTKNLLYLGEIPRKYPETQVVSGEIARGGIYEQDQILDDSSLVYVNGKGKDKALTVIAGCAHSGIINTIEHAKVVTGINRVHAVIGGIHMKGASEAVRERTLNYFAAQDTETLRCCHCTEDALDGTTRQKSFRTGDHLEIV